LCVKYDTAWLQHNKILRAMADQELVYLVQGKIQIDGSYIVGDSRAASRGC
jgi:hypothetical protein